MAELKVYGAVEAFASSKRIHFSFYKKFTQALYNILKFTGKLAAKIKCNYVVCLTTINFPFVAVKQILFFFVPFNNVLLNCK